MAFITEVPLGSKANSQAHTPVPSEPLKHAFPSVSFVWDAAQPTPLPALHAQCQPPAILTKIAADSRFPVKINRAKFRRLFCEKATQHLLQDAFWWFWLQVCPRWGLLAPGSTANPPPQKNDPADAHPSSHKAALESTNPAWARSGHVDAPGQRHRQQPVSGTADPAIVVGNKVLDAPAQAIPANVHKVQAETRKHANCYDTPDYFTTGC